MAARDFIPSNSNSSESVVVTRKRIYRDPYNASGHGVISHVSVREAGIGAGRGKVGKEVDAKKTKRAAIASDGSGIDGGTCRIPRKHPDARAKSRNKISQDFGVVHPPRKTGS